MIASWLASKLWGLVIFAIACLSVVLLPALIVQSVRLNGFSVLGWEWSEGFRPIALRLERENVKLVANNLVISDGLNKCNIGVKGLEAARLSFQSEAQKLVDERLRLQKEYASRIARVNAIKPTHAVCPTVDAIYNAGFGK